MKTLYTTYNNFAKRLVMSLIVLMTVGVGSVLGDNVTLNSSTITNGKKLAYTTEWTYTANNVTWSGYCYTDANNRPWVQLKADAGVYIKITTPDDTKITKLETTITGTQNTSGGITDITKHPDFSGRIALLTEDVKGSASMTGVAYTTSVSNDIATLSPSGENNVLYLKVSAGARIWSMTVTYESLAPSCTYTVTFDGNGNTGGSMSAQEFNCGESKALTPNAFTKTGHTFAGWVTTANGSVEYTDKESVNLSSTNGDDITLYAKWTANKYTVKFNGNGNTGGSMSDQSFTYGTAQNLTPNAFEKYGHTFAGWSKTSDGSVAYTDGQSVSNLTSTNNGTVTLHAKWTEKSLTNYRTSCSTKTVITLSPQGGTGGTTSVTATYGQPMPEITVPTLAGYDFQGYFTANGGSGTQYYNADGTSARDWDKEDATFTLIAYWKAKTYTVTLNNQGATTAGATSVTATYNAAMPSIANNLPKKTGYTFNGYFDATSAGTKYYNADGTSAKKWDKTASTTLYAQWTCETPVFDIKIKNDNPVIFSGETIELIVVGSNIAADATYQWYKGEDEIVGETTDKLTIANATADDAGNYKCEVSNATCSAENNYTVKMYHIKGLTDGTWTIPFEFVKSGDKEGTFSVELAANTTYYFKLNDGSVWYWNEGTMTHNNCTDWVIEQEGADTQGKANTGITTTASGTYTFTLNYEDPAKPKLSVIYPQKKMVYLNPGEWNCAKYAVYSWNGEGNSTVLMTKIDDCADRNIYQAEIDASHSNVIFIGGTASYNVANTWNNVSYQTIDLTYPSDDNVLYELSTTHLFLQPNSNWKESNARFAAYFYGNGETWVNMTKVTADLYKVAIPTTKTYPSVIFCLMNPSAAANNWNNKWNQSADLTITNGKNHYTVAEGAWDKGDGTWKTAGEWTSFTPNYSVTFDANGHGTAPADQCIAEGGKATNPGNLSTTGYTFGGWYKEAGCTNAWDFAADVVIADITLYAKWTAKTITITWNANGGTVSPATATYTYDGAAVELPTPTRTGYTFNGWFTAASGGTKITEVGTTNKPATNVTYYAQWTPKQITITWDANGGSVDPTTSTYTYDGAVVELPTPTRANYIFDGWFTAASGGTQITEVGTTNKPAADVTYYAQWTEKTTPTFAWSKDSYTAALEADNTFPTLSNPNSLSVTYTSSDENVAKIDANGNITLGSEGKITITANGAESATYKSATDTYELIVVAANCKWVEVTDNTTLEDGDEVVISMTLPSGTSYALPNESKTGEVPDAIKITNTKSFANGYIWIISKNGNNLTFKSYDDASDFLTCNNADDGVRVNSGANKTFVIDATYSYLKNTTNDRYVGVHNEKTQWYSYRLTGTGAFPGKIAGQTLKFYKRECLDVTKVWVEGNLTNVTCAPQLPQQLAKDGSITLTFTAADGYALPDNVTVTNAKKVWDKSTGKLTISKPTDNVLITMDAVKMHTVTWMVGSSSVLTEEVANGTGVTKTPTDDPADDAIGDCADTFMGWSEKSAGSTPQNEDYYSDLCTADEMKDKHTSVTEDKTFYAVFATASNSGSGSTTEQVFATTDIVSSTGVTTGYTISAQAEKKDGYYQVGSGDKRYVQVKKTDVSMPMIANVPVTLTVTAKLGGGSENSDLTNSVYAILLDADGNEMGDAVLLTDKITNKTGSNFTASLPVANATDAYGVRVYHQKESGYNVRYYAISLSYTYNNVSYSNYVTQCCTDWTPTFTYSNSTLDANTNETATPTISGNAHGASVAFVSSNTSVLTVDANGKITAVGAGRATITATWEKTGDYCEKSVTSNEITVNGNFSVTFHKNDGSSETTTQQIPSNTATALNANTFQREGYSFQGWATSASGSVAYTDGQKVTLTTAGLNLYAVWKINSYKITTAAAAHGTVTTSPANQANFNAQVTITTTPDAHYTVSSIVVTRDDNSQTVSVTGNKFTMPASDVTVTVVFTENPKYNIIYNIPTGGGELVDGYPTFIYSDGSITLPNIKSGTISSEYSCEEFIGWTTNSATHEAAGLKPDPFYAIGASLSGITQNTTLYAVYSRAGNGLGGTVTLTATEMEGWATAQSYGTERELTTCVGTWKTTGVKSTGNPIQLRATDNPYVEFPELQGNITQVVLNATNGSNATLTSGTFTLKTIDGQTITSASVNSSGVCTLTVTGSHKTARLYSSVTARIANISISYGPAAIISTTLSCTNDIDECTVTYDLNESFLAVGTQVLGSCTNSTFRFSEIGEYTICSEPQANEYRLIGWNNQCDGKGSLTFTPGQVISSLPQNIITLYAQWVPEVIVHDSYEETKVYPTEMGGSITLNPGQYICDPQKYEFIGWTTEDPQLWQQQNISPTLLEENQDGTVTFTPTEPSQVYAVYAIEDMANSDAFRLSSNVEGTTYYVGYDANRSGGVIARSNIEDALTFYKEIIDAEENKYLLYYIDPGEQDKEYLYYSGSSLSTSNNPSTNNYGWIFHTSGTGYKFQSIGYQTRYLSITSSNVQTNTTGSVFNIETIAEYKYVAKTNCSETVTITFVPGNGTMTPSTNPVTAKTGDVITLPTCEYEGWTFLGWVTENIEITEFEIDPSRLYNGNYEVGNSDVTLYAYYTQIPESAEFDGTTSEVYKMYCEVDDKYYYAISHGSSRPGTLPSSNICLNAEEWVFTNTGEANVYYIQDHNNLYLTPEVNNTQLFFTSTPFPWKVVEIGTTNTYRIYAYNTRNDDYSRLIMFQSGAFYHSAKNNESNSAWHHVTIGGCQNPVYTTDPQPSKVISLVGSPMITSTINQTVKASQQLQLVLKDMEANTSVTIAGDGLTFYDADNNEVTTLQTGPNGSLTATLTVAYTPTIADNQIVNPAITVNCGSASRTFYNVTCRSLPADFVIAAKTGNSWVALTANITSTGTQAAPLIMVDNIALPTKATITPNTTKYQLLGLQKDKPNIADSRFKNNGAAVHLYSTNVSKVISASTSTDNNKTYINADAAHEGAANSPNCLFYEWQLQTNDLVHYTLVNSNTTNTSNTKLGYSATYAQWGMYQTGNNVIQEVLLLPIEKDITEMDVEVMEWGINSMALRFGSEAPATVDITLGATTTTNLSLTNLNSGNTSDIYKVEGLTLTDNECKALLITDATDASKGKLLRTPILVNGEKNGSDYTNSPTRDVCMHSDIVILNGGKLTADEAKSVGSHVDFANIYVYPGGKLVLDGNSLGVKRQVYLRGGYSWLNSTYALPEVYVNDDINFNGSGNMIYDYYIQNQKYYQFALPYDVQLAKVTDESGADDFPVWVKHYNGALRAADAYATSWEWYPSENGDANAYFEAGIGYIIAAKPRQVGNVANRPLSIIRFPLSNRAFTGGEGDKSVVTTAHGIDGYKEGTVTANNVGWNFIGNPFMATWKGDIGHKELAKHPDENNWDGSYHWVDSDVKFITIMSPEDGSDYAQTRAADADLKPFFPFYIQETADGGSGTINFAAANRVKKAPALWNVEQDEREAYIQIEIAMDAVADQTGVFVSNKYSDEIDFDDYEKMFGSSTDKPKVWLVHDNTRLAFEAMTENRATGMTPLGYRAPQDGEYMLVLNDEVSQLNNVESIYLTDYETGVTGYDLTSSAYEFESTTTLYNDTRFAIRVVMKDNTQGSVTAVDNVGTGDEQIYKFIYRDKMYILHHGVIYDATGKKVTTINK